MTDLYGTAYYMAPEMVKGQYTESSDVWSCGIILYTMIMGKVPFDGFSEKEIFKNILNQPVMLRAALEKGKSTECVDLMKRSLYKIPDQRLTAMDCMTHKWIRVYGRDS